MSSKYISKRAAGMEPYMPDKYEYDILMNANESPFGIDGDIEEAFYAALQEAEVNRYPDPYARKLCRLYAKRAGVSGENIVAGNGSDELISLIFTAFTDKGDKVAIAEPDFSMYAFYASLNGTEVCSFKKGDDGVLDLDALCEYVKENNCKLVIFSNPCNPTGIGIERDRVLAFVEKCPVPVVVDEAYMDFWDQSITPETPKYDNLIVLKTLSKAFGLAGCRVGFAICNKDLADAIKAVKSPYNVNVLSQIMAIAVLKENSIYEENIEIIKDNTVALYDSIKESCEGIDGVYVYPTQANFVCVRIPNATKIRAELKKSGIGVRQTDENHLRITASNEYDTDAFIDKFAEAIKEVFGK